MEIINETLHSVGEIDGQMLFIAIFLGIVSIFFITIAIISGIDWEWGIMITCIIAGIFFILLDIISWQKVRNQVEYRSYDVIFTEPIDMNELDEKYIIKGHDGKIWHLEDKH